MTISEPPLEGGGIMEVLGSCPIPQELGAKSRVWATCAAGRRKIQGEKMSTAPGGGIKREKGTDLVSSGQAWTG